MLLSGAGLILALVVAGPLHAMRPPHPQRSLASPASAAPTVARIDTARPTPPLRVAAPAPTDAPVPRARPAEAEAAATPSASATPTATPTATAVPAASPGAGAPDEAPPADEPPRARELTVWIAGDPARANGWSWPKEPLSLSPALAPTVMHQGRSAVRLYTAGGKIAIWGWNWLGWYPPSGTDISAMKTLLVSLRVAGADKPTSVRLGLDCATRKYTKEYELLPHYPRLTDGGWHEVEVPLAKLIGGSEFDPHMAWELRLIAEAPALVTADIYLDNFGFSH